LGQIVALHAIDPDGSDLVQLNDGGSAFPSWSPDGSRIAFGQQQPDGSWQIATMAPDGSDVQLLTSGPGIHEIPSWSPDGTWIAYGYSPVMPDDPSFRPAIYRMDADGSNQALLGHPDAFDAEPRISPDGTRVLFLRLTPGDWFSNLVVRDLSTGEESTLDGAGDFASHPDWSRDGQWIIYNVNTGDLASQQVWRIAADGSSEPELLVADAPTFKPSYSPDGAMIVFGCRQRLDDDALCIAEADGADPRVVVDAPGVHENHFSWGPPAT
jgi:TolB protein